MAKVWAGIGSRETPKQIMDKMVKIAYHLGQKDYWCRTGAARCADQAFGVGKPDKTILYLPWRKYEETWVDTVTKVGAKIGCFEPTVDALSIAKDYHPGWSVCSVGAQRLHGRNSHIVLGKQLDSLVQFIVYWALTDGYGNPLGGTGQAIRIAKSYSIPTYNLNDNMETKALAALIDIGEL
jgi:hypothetical protein